VRFVSEHFSTHMLRADWELAQPASGEIDHFDHRRAQRQQPA
jgi:hypothetical protein